MGNIIPIIIVIWRLALELLFSLLFLIKLLLLLLLVLVLLTQAERKLVCYQDSLYIVFLCCFCFTSDLASSGGVAVLLANH